MILLLLFFIPLDAMNGSGNAELTCFTHDSIYESDCFGNTALIRAAKLGDQAHLESLLPQSDLTKKNLKGKQALHYVLESKSVALLEPFLVRNASLYTSSENLAKVEEERLTDGKARAALEENKILIEEYAAKWYVNFSQDYSPFEILWNEAIKSGFCGLMAYLIMVKKRDNRKPRLPNGLTAFQLAAEANQPLIVELLIINSEDLIGDLCPPEAPNNSPLAIAARNNCERIVELLAQKASTDCPKAFQEAEHSAKTPEIKDILWAWQINVASHRPRFGGEEETPLHSACRNRSIKALRIILKRGGERFLESRSRGYTPLHVAIWHGRSDVVILLVDRGASIRVQCEHYAMLPIHLAAACMEEDVNESNYREIVKLLLQAGANVNEKSEYCLYTPLFFAVQNRKHAMAKLLLERGASIRSVNNKKQTTLHLAVEGDDDEMVELLLSHGADAEARDNEKRRPTDLVKSEKIRQLFAQIKK